MWVMWGGAPTQERSKETSLSQRPPPPAPLLGASNTHLFSEHVTWPRTCQAGAALLGQGAFGEVPAASG